MRALLAAMMVSPLALSAAAEAQVPLPLVRDMTAGAVYGSITAVYDIVTDTRRASASEGREQLAILRETAGHIEQANEQLLAIDQRLQRIEVALEQEPQRELFIDAIALSRRLAVNVDAFERSVAINMTSSDRDSIARSIDDLANELEALVFRARSTIDETASVRLESISAVNALAVSIGLLNASDEVFGLATPARRELLRTRYAAMLQELDQTILVATSGPAGLGSRADELVEEYDRLLMAERRSNASRSSRGYPYPASASSCRAARENMRDLSEIIEAAVDANGRGVLCIETRHSTFGRLHDVDGCMGSRASPVRVAERCNRDNGGVVASARGYGCVRYYRDYVPFTVERYESEGGIVLGEATFSADGVRREVHATSDPAACPIQRDFYDGSEVASVFAAYNDEARGWLVPAYQSQSAQAALALAESTQTYIASLQGSI